MFQNFKEKKKRDIKYKIKTFMWQTTWVIMLPLYEALSWQYQEMVSPNNTWPFSQTNIS